MGPVHLSVSSLARSIEYYETWSACRSRRNDGDVARLGAGGEDLLVLHEEPGARPARGFAGLFHFALLLPERTDLARWLVHAVARRRSALERPVRPRRQRGALPARPGRPRHRDLLGPPARDLGGPGPRAA